MILKLRLALEEEVNKYLSRIIAVLLDPDFKVKWNPLFNNCQALVDGLLKGKDFEYFFPRLPKHIKGESSAEVGMTWLQYLMSFHDRIAGKFISLHQPHSFVTKFFSDKGFPGDLINFIESVIKDQPTAVKYSALLLKNNQQETFEQPEQILNTLWEMPHDTVSILQFQLIRMHPKYAIGARSGPTLGQWLRKRLLLLLQLDIFASYSGALGSCILEFFERNPSFTSKVVIPKSRVMGTVRAGERGRMLQYPGKQIVYLIASEVDVEFNRLFNAP